MYCIMVQIVNIFIELTEPNTGDPSHVPITNIPTSSGVHYADIAIHPNNPDKIMVVFSNYSTYSLFYSDDAGSSWNKVAGNLEENQVVLVVVLHVEQFQIIDFGNSTFYIVGTSVGLLLLQIN